VSWIALQPRSASSVERSVVRRRLRVMFTMTTDEDIAIDSPIRAAGTGARPATMSAAVESAVVTTTCSGAARTRPRCSRRIRRMSTSMPTSKSSSTTPRSARSWSCSRSAT
jgi:hypothetical protein